MSTKVPIFNEEGEINGLIGIGTNITERKKIEEEQSLSYKLLNDQNNRLKNFSYIVSHNLRSHVSNIKTIANLLNTNLDKNESEELLKYLKTVVGSLDDTIVNLNTVVEIQNNLTIEVSTINLKISVDSVIGLMGMQVANKKVAIKVSIPKDLTIRHNPAYLESILLNIISNAVKYSDTQKESYLHISSYLRDNYTVLEVRDNGLGIDMKRNGNKLFGMYKTFHSQTHPEAKGIGLFITKNQIESLGGKIEVESDLGIGSTFRIFFR